MPGTLFVVATPIGNLEDITARALRILREAAVIAAEDTRRTANLLTRYGITTPTTSLHEHNEGQKSRALIEQLRRGDSVALVSDAGTPAISDPGAHLVAAAAAEGIRVESVPGPNAAITALAASGFPSQSFTFLGFPPTRSKDRRNWFVRVQQAGGTIVFYEAPHRIRETLLDLRRTVGDCPVLVCRELTKTHEELVRGPISDVLNARIAERGEFTVVLNLVEQHNTARQQAPTGQSLSHELGEITERERISKRKAINVIARRHGMPPNEVYSLLEKAKESGK
jgi:16S rRNA (cytidine1402-2'-O)-methyltransferase